VTYPEAACALSHSQLSLVEFRLVGELLRSRRTGIGQRTINSKTVPKHHERSINSGAKIVDHSPKKLMKGIGVQRRFALAGLSLSQGQKAC
jgi:hypothetical protein